MAALVGVSAFATAMREQPIALFPRDANVQHYEVPSGFFEQVLGPQLKYSCCLYPAADTTLAQAEEFALAETALHADLADGQEILELGCGWGSLTLWMAERFPAARITAVSNSAPQRVHIERRAAERGLVNLQVITADMNNFAIAHRFDRAVSVEMFEHMSNWPRLLANVHDWLRRGGGCFCTSSVIRRRRIGSTTTTARTGSRAWMTAPRRSTRCCARPTARTGCCGAGAGGCSSWRLPAFSVMTTAGNGV